MCSYSNYDISLLVFESNLLINIKKAILSLVLCETRKHAESLSLPTQPSIPPGLVNEYQLRLGRQRQVWFILLADERGVHR